MTTLTRTRDTIHVFFEQQKGPKIVREENGNVLIEGVKLLGYESLNGRRYLEPEAKLYEGKKVNLNHPGMFNGATVESTIGRVRPGTVEVNKQGVWGTLELNPNHSQTETTIWNVENLSREMGMSHVAATEEVEKTEAGDGIPTYRVLEVISVDIVGRPATTRGFFESIATPDTDKESIVELTEALAKLADMTAKLGARDAEVLALKAEIVASKEAILTEKQAHDATKAEHALASRTELLSKYEEDKDLKDIVLSAESFDRAKALVEKFGKLLKAEVKAKTPISRLQSDGSPDAVKAQKFEEIDFSY